MATDFHERPAALHGINNVTWIPCDLNEDFAEKINQRFNLVVSITVIEHVLSPYDFILNSNKLLEQKGTLYITAPCTNTLALKVLGKSWAIYNYG
jgi:2-polyprenyl-3-methyl-5-hydroxy-6-metoxy-1,4-benzoquinol methylase